MNNESGSLLGQLLSLFVIMSILVYAFACILLGRKRTGGAFGALVTGTCKGVTKIAVRILKIAVMFVINFTTMIIRIIGRPDQVQEAWARFIERMADVIFGA